MQYPRIELLFKGPVFRGSGIHIQQDSLFTSRAGHDLPPDGVEPQGGQVLQELVSVSIVKNTAVVLIGELAGNVGIAGDRQGGVVEAETALIKIRGNGVVEPPELLRTVQGRIKGRKGFLQRFHYLALLISGIFLTAALLVVFINERFQFIDLALELRAFHSAEVQFGVGFLQRLPQSGVVPNRGDQVPDFHVTPPF